MLSVLAAGTIPFVDLSDGARSATLALYQWANSQPTTFPSGSSTYTWATGVFTAPATLNGWSLAPGSGLAGQTLYVCRQYYSDTLLTATSTVVWSATACSAIGTCGVNGKRTAILQLYKQATSTPTTFPSGSSTYTWATGVFTAPATLNGWSLAPPALSAGYRLYVTQVVYTDNDTSDTSTVTWPTSGQVALNVSYCGVNGGSYLLFVDAGIIKKSQSGAYTPASVNVSLKYQTGSNAPVDYAGRIVISESADGSAYTDVYTSSANEVSKTYTPTSSVISLRIRMYIAGGITYLVGEKIIPIVKDGINAITMTSATEPSGTYDGQIGIWSGKIYKWDSSNAIWSLYDASAAQLSAIADDSIISPQEKGALLSKWYPIVNDIACISSLPTISDGAISAGQFETIRNQAANYSLWTPTTESTSAKNYYDATEALRAYLFSTPAVLKDSTWDSNISIDKTTHLNLWAAQSAAYDALSLDVQNAALKIGIPTYTPKCLGLYPYSALSNITGAHIGDLVVIYSDEQSERGIYIYGIAWVKEETPASEHISKCLLQILIATSSSTRTDSQGTTLTVAYGISSDYVGGSVSFETLLVKALYAQKADIKDLIVEFIEATDITIRGKLEAVIGSFSGSLDTPLIKTVPEQAGDSVSVPSAPYWKSLDFVNAIGSGKLSASGSWRGNALAYTYKGDTVISAATLGSGGYVGKLYASDRNTWYPIATLTAPCSGRVRLAATIHTHVSQTQYTVDGDTFYRDTPWNLDATLEINRNVVASANPSGTLPAGSTDYSGNYGVVTLNNQSVWVNAGDTIQVWMRHAYAFDAYVDSLTIYPENGSSAFLQYSDGSYFWLPGNVYYTDTGTLTLNGTTFNISALTHYWHGSDFVGLFDGRQIALQNIAMNSSADYLFNGKATASIYYKPGEYLQITAADSSVITIYCGEYYNLSGQVKFKNIPSSVAITNGMSVAGKNTQGDGMIEIGNNASGWYLKFSNGVMICVQSVNFSTSIDVGSVYAFDLSFPIVFANGPWFVVPSLHCGWASEFPIAIETQGTQKVTGFIYHTIGNNHGSLAYNIQFFAIGAWK